MLYFKWRKKPQKSQYEKILKKQIKMHEKQRTLTFRRMAKALVDSIKF